MLKLTFKPYNFNKRLCGLIIGLFFSSILLAQENTSAWKILAQVSFKTKETGKYKTEYPVFGKEVQALNGKMITLRGYVLPLEVGNDNQMMFSLYPYNLCYFCGGAGPETVVEVRTHHKIPYSSKPITIRGKLRLNDSDYEHLMYILEEAMVNEQ